MNMPPDTAKPRTKGAGPRKFDQLAGQIDYIRTNSQPQKQGRTFQIILILRWIADLIGAAGVR